MTKTASKLFSLNNSSQKPPFFAVLMYSLYGHPRYFKFKRKYQQYGPHFQTIFPFLMIMLVMIFKTLFHVIKLFYLITNHLWVVNSGLDPEYGKNMTSKQNFNNNKSTDLSIWILHNLKTNTTIVWLRNFLILSRRRSLWYGNQCIYLQSKSMDWFLYDKNLCRERVKELTSAIFTKLLCSYRYFW